MPWTAQPLPYASLNGLSERQISEHYKLYEGYVNKQNEIETRLNNVDWSQANATFSEARELKVEESFSLNAIRLHEAYFNGLGASGEQPTGDVQTLLEADFGSVDNWKTEFLAEGIAARGWVVCAFDWATGCLRNFVADAHNLYNIWNCTPIIVLDVYEHAYFADYGTNRKEYLQSWLQNINWSHINSLISDYGIMQNHTKHEAA